MKSEWKKIPIKDLCIGIYDGPHATPPKSDSGAVFLGIPNFSNGRLDLSNVRYISEDDLPRWTKRVTPQAHDIVFSYEATLNLYAIIPDGFHGCLGRRMALMRPDESKVNYKFLYYYMFSSEWREEIERHKVFGSTVDRIPLISFPSFMVNLPDMATQEYIANILSALDEKIALNNKINENLEQQARLTLNWWMGEHSREYKSLPLSDIATVNDSVYSPKEQWHFVNYLDTSSITDGIITELQHIVPAIDKLPSRARRKIVTNDIVFSTVRPNQHHFGIIKQPVSNMLVSTGFAVIRSKTKEICNELIYLRLTEDSFIESMQQIAEQSTSTFPSIKPSDLYQCEIPCPIDDKLTILLENVFSIIAINQKENLGLSQLRDALLPKLMNGEIEL